MPSLCMDLSRFVSRAFHLPWAVHALIPFPFSFPGFTGTALLLLGTTDLAYVQGIVGFSVLAYRSSWDV